MAGSIYFFVVFFLTALPAGLKASCKALIASLEFFCSMMQDTLISEVLIIKYINFMGRQGFKNLRRHSLSDYACLLQQWKF